MKRLLFPALAGMATVLAVGCQHSRPDAPQGADSTQAVDFAEDLEPDGGRVTPRLVPVLVEQPAPLPDYDYAPLDELFVAGAWVVRDFGASGSVEIVDGQLVVSYAITEPAPRDKCVTEQAAELDLARAAGLSLDVNRASEGDLELALGIKSAGTYYESRPVRLHRERNLDVFFDFKIGDFKCEDTDWEYRASPTNLAETTHLSLLLYGQGKGAVAISNLRLASGVRASEDDRRTPPAGSVLLPVEGDGGWDYVDGYGRLRIRGPFEEAMRFAGGFARVRMAGKYGFINSLGQFAIEPAYDDALDFSYGAAAVRVGDAWGYIDAGGRLFVPARFERVGSFSDGLAPVLLDGVWGYIGADGDFALAAQYADATVFRDGLAAVRLKKAWGYINTAGESVVAARYEAAHPFRGGLAAVRLDGKWGFIDRRGDMAIDPAYDHARGFSQTFAAVQLDSRWGYIDNFGELVIPATYDMATDFSEDRAGVLVNGRWGYIDREGRMVVEPRFDFTWPYVDGLAGVETTVPVRGRMEAVRGYIDKAGRAVWEAK